MRSLLDPLARGIIGAVSELRVGLPVPLDLGFNGVDPLAGYSVRPPFGCPHDPQRAASIFSPAVVELANVLYAGLQVFDDHLRYTARMMLSPNELSATGTFLMRLARAIDVARRTAAPPREYLPFVGDWEALRDEHGFALDLCPLAAWGRAGRAAVMARVERWSRRRLFIEASFQVPLVATIDVSERRSEMGVLEERSWFEPRIDPVFDEVLKVRGVPTKIAKKVLGEDARLQLLALRELGQVRMTSRGVAIICAPIASRELPMLIQRVAEAARVIEGAPAERMNKVVGPYR